MKYIYCEWDDGYVVANGNNGYITVSDKTNTTIRGVP